MVHKIQLFIISFCILIVTSCGLVNEQAVMIPAYININSFSFVTDSISQGANSQAINDMWVSNDGIIIGTTGLPTLLPIQKVGPTEIRIDAGIDVSGQDDQRTAYPLLATVIQTRTLRANVVDTFTPVFRYVVNADFKFIEDYDRVSRVFKINPSYYLLGDTVKLVNDENAWKPGSSSGKIEIAAGHQVLQLITDKEYDLLGQGSPVYIEIDYKSNLNLDIGYYFDDPITGTSAANSFIQTYPTTTWKKLYLNLTNEITSRTVGTKYIFYIGVYNFDNLVPDVYIDNIKLIGIKG